MRSANKRKVSSHFVLARPNWSRVLLPRQRRLTGNEWKMGHTWSKMDGPTGASRAKKGLGTRSTAVAVAVAEFRRVGGEEETQAGRWQEAEEARWMKDGENWVENRWSDGRAGRVNEPEQSKEWGRTAAAATAAMAVSARQVGCRQVGALMTSRPDWFLLFWLGWTATRPRRRDGGALQTPLARRGPRRRRRRRRRCLSNKRRPSPLAWRCCDRQRQKRRHKNALMTETPSAPADSGGSTRKYVRPLVVGTRRSVGPSGGVRDGRKRRPMIRRRHRLAAARCLSDGRR